MNWKCIKDPFASGLLRREAAAKSKQQPRGPLNPNLSSEQRPHQIGFFVQKAKPGLTVGDDVQIGLCFESVCDTHGLVTNHYGGLPLFLTR